jgi:hypothetical protein
LRKVVQGGFGVVEGGVVLGGSDAVGASLSSAARGHDGDQSMPHASRLRLRFDILLVRAGVAEEADGVPARDGALGGVEVGRDGRALPHNREVHLLCGGVGAGHQRDGFFGFARQPELAEEGDFRAAGGVGAADGAAPEVGNRRLALHLRVERRECLFSAFQHPFAPAFHFAD